MYNITFILLSVCSQTGLSNWPVDKITASNAAIRQALLPLIVFDIKRSSPDIYKKNVLWCCIDLWRHRNLEELKLYQMKLNVSQIRIFQVFLFKQCVSCALTIMYGDDDASIVSNLTLLLAINISFLVFYWILTNSEIVLI